MTEETKRARSPRVLGFFTWTGSAFLSILLIWLFGFVLSDVGEFRAVELDGIEERYVSAELRERESGLQAEIRELDRRIEAVTEKRDFLRDGVSTDQRTMSQVLDLQRTSIERNVPLSEEQQRALTAAQQSFLARQDEYQEASASLLALRDEKRDVQAALDELQADLQEKRTAAWAEYEHERERRDMQAAALKIGVLLPVIAAAVWLFLKKRASALAPLVYALGFAVLYRLVVIVHDYFPSRVYKYVFLIAAIAVVLRVLSTVIRLAVSPPARTLVKRYREAYDRARCPFCSYPILRGSAERVHAAKRAGGRQLSITLADASAAEPYTCPSCSQPLFETCSACGKVRHSLLPSCMHCGGAKAHPGVAG